MIIELTNTVKNNFNCFQTYKWFVDKVIASIEFIIKELKRI